ncbi:MAG: YceI family protein [Proteobacteria bacterium]|nr:YceI family protein [Pseudomonadota bacterium]
MKKAKAAKSVRDDFRTATIYAIHQRGDSLNLLAAGASAFPRFMLGAIVAINFLPVPAAHAARFVFDQRRTEVRFVYKIAYAKQRGRFTKVAGTLDYDEGKPGKSKIKATIAAASLTTGDALIDSELKGASFFNAAASPIITFKSIEVHAGSAMSADVAGEVTVNGVTKPVTLNVTIEPHDDPALKYDVGTRKFLAKTRIQRSAFNMVDYQAMVDDEVDIEIEAIARPR